MTETIITKTESQKNMEKFRTQANDLCKKYNNLDIKKTTKDEIDKILADLNKAVDNYNENAWCQMLSEIKESDDKMKAAVEKFSYEVIRIKDNNVGTKEEPVINKSIDDASKIIDLKKVHDHVPNGMGNNTKWYSFIEKFNLLMTIRVSADISAKDAADIKAMTKVIIQTFDIPADSKDVALTADVISTNKMIAATQLVVDAMLGEGYKVTSHDTKFIEWRYGKKSRNKCCVACSTTRELVEIMLHVCNKLVTGGKYEAEYRKA